MISNQEDMMKITWIRRALSFILAGAMVVCLVSAAAPSVRVYAEETEEEGENTAKYVSDVFIAYGSTEKKATEWLKKNGWEPVEGDFNAGKASFFDDNVIQDQNVAAVMGIKRTDDKNDAITDMAVMNMKGGYSIPEYEKLLEQKKTEINEYINSFKVVLEEYRENRQKEGSDFGKARADLSYEMLNKFYDGDPEDPVAVHDTGKKLGDLFDIKTMQEGNKSGGDLEQLMLESSGPAVLVMETFLAFGADTADDTWLDRASGLTGDELSENLPKYVPEAEGRDVADSEVPQYLNEKYGDTAATLAEQWSDVHEEMLWFEEYNDANELWPHDGEDEEGYVARVDSFFEELIKQDEEKGTAEQGKYTSASMRYYNLYEVKYEGEWGETLGDFFNPADEEWCYPAEDFFLPMAAALSDGQRASMDILSLQMLLMLGFGNIDAVKKALPNIKKEFGDLEKISIYTGVNREAFRGGVALTSDALMEQNAGKGEVFDQIWDNTGIVAMTSYVAAALGAVTLVSGIVMTIKGVKYTGRFADAGILKATQRILKMCKQRMKTYAADTQRYATAESTYNELAPELEENTHITKAGTAGRWMMGIGGAILIGAAIVKGIQMYKYYQRDMTPIPRMIVDEADIVTYLTDDNGDPVLDGTGNQKKVIDFKTYEYYSAVKCNRPDVGEIGDWQDGVSDYKNAEHYCYDIADLNADMGQEWIALYTVKSSNKGDPILADSLTLQYGSKDMPKGCSKKLHLFTYTNAVDLGDTAWAFNNGKKGVYFFWDEDANAFAEETASAFSGGQLALAGIGGLILGIAGASLVLTKKRRKDEPEAA